MFWQALLEPRIQKLEVLVFMGDDHVTFEDHDEHDLAALADVLDPN